MYDELSALFDSRADGDSLSDHVVEESDSQSSLNDTSNS